MSRRDPVIGRERELASVGEILSRTAGGEGGLLLLAGEAGAGKTRLAEAAVAAAELPCLRGVAAEQGATPYAPIAAVLRGYLRRERDGLPTSEPLLAHLGVLLPELGPPPSVTDRETLFEAVREAFRTISARGASVIFLDDLQWADAATLELLPSLAEAAEEWPLLLLGAYRSDEIPRGHPLRRLRTELRRAGRLAELGIGPLDADATARLAARVLGGAPGPALSAALYDRTQGVPFFVEELAAALRESARLAGGEGGLELADGSRVPIPETVRDAVRVRTEGVSDEGRAALEAAAVIGTEVDLELLAELGRDAGLREALDRGLLEETGPGIVAFRHDLVREALLGDTHWTNRRSLHRELAGVFERLHADPKLTAEHWLAAGESERALPLLVEAARRFCEVHAYRDAAAAGRAALEIWPAGADEAGRLHVLDQLGRCAQLCGELTEAGRVWEEVAAGLAEAGEPGPLADVKRRLATLYELEGASPRAAATRLEAAEAFEAAGLDEDAARELYFAAGRLSDDVSVAERVLARALEAARRAGNTNLESRCLGAFGYWAARTGRREEGVERMRSALSLALDGNDVEAAVVAYWRLGAAANDWGDYATAESVFDEAVVYCRANERAHEEHHCLGCLVLVLGNAGEWARAEQLARELLDRAALPDAHGELPEAAHPHALLTLGLISAARGASKRARRLLEQAQALASGRLEQSEHECSFGLAIVDELEGTPSPRWAALVAHRTERIFFGRPASCAWPRASPRGGATPRSSTPAPT